MVCDPRKNASMREGNQNRQDRRTPFARIVASRPSLVPVYHGEHGLRSLKELVRSYLTITKDLGRVMFVVKAIYRSWAIPCSGKQVRRTAPSGRVAGEDHGKPVRLWLSFTTNNWMRCGRYVNKCAGSCSRKARNSPAWKRLRPDSVDRSDPGRRTAGYSADPAPFPQQAAAVELWRLGHQDRKRADHRKVNGQLERAKKQVAIRGLEPATAIMT